MSDNPEDMPDDTPAAGGGFGKFKVDDSKIGVIRRPENSHMDEGEQEKPAE